MSSNPSSSSSELVIKSDTLDYGIYKIVYNVTQLKNDLEGLNFFNTFDYSYFNIIPTGLAVYGLPNGVTKISIGYSQTLELDPSSYSIDFDSLLDLTSLDFKFYCRVIDNSIITNDFPSLLNQTLDLSSIKNDANIELSNNLTCFSSRGFFKSNNNYAFT